MSVRSFRSRWSSAIAILRRRLAWQQAEREAVRELWQKDGVPGNAPAVPNRAAPAAEQPIAGVPAARETTAE